MQTFRRTYKIKKERERDKILFLIFSPTGFGWLFFLVVVLLLLLLLLPGVFCVCVCCVWLPLWALTDSRHRRFFVSITTSTTRLSARRSFERERNRAYSDTIPPFIHCCSTRNKSLPIMLFPPTSIAFWDTHIYNNILPASFRGRLSKSVLLISSIIWGGSFQTPITTTTTTTTCTVRRALCPPVALPALYQYISNGKKKKPKFPFIIHTSSSSSSSSSSVVSIPACLAIYLCTQQQQQQETLKIDVLYEKYSYTQIEIYI